MSKSNVNNITGFDFFQARENIGLSLSKVAGMTGLNRNKLTQFEQEKGTLAANEKRTLKNFYEERGHDFDEPEEVSGIDIGTSYQLNKSEVIDTIHEHLPNELGEALMCHIDSTHDVLVANGYLKYLHTVQGGETSQPVPEAYQSLANELWKHFVADKQGEFKNEGGFFGGAASERGQKLVGLLAYQQLQLMHDEKPDVITLSIAKAEKQTDNRRLLEVLTELLGQNKPKAFNHIDSTTLE